MVNEGKHCSSVLADVSKLAMSKLVELLVTITSELISCMQEGSELERKAVQFENAFGSFESTQHNLLLNHVEEDFIHCDIALLAGADADDFDPEAEISKG